MLKMDNPHDKFIKDTLTQKENAISFLKNYLPQDIKNVINPEKITIMKDSYISDELDEYFSDLLYKVDIDGKEGYVYILFEHKSNPDNNLALQLLKYMVRIWEAKQKQEQTFPLIVPMVIYHGQQTWNVASNFSEIIEFDNKIFTKYVPDFKYILHNLNDYNDNEIVGTDELRARLEIMKYIKSEKFLDKFVEILDFINEKLGMDVIKPIILYVYNTRNEDWDEFVELAGQKSKKGGEIIMTIAEQLEKKGLEKGKKEGKKEGIQEGIKEGKKEEQIEIAQNMLQKDMDLDTIAEVTGLSISKVKNLQNKD